MAIEKQISSCPLDCFDVCSFVVTVEDGVVTEIAGNKEHPITKGFICEKGRKHMQRIYNPERLKYPMKRVNDQWVRIDWEEAYNTISNKLKEYVKEFGPLSISHYYDAGAGGLLKNVEDLFFKYLGGATEFEGSLCWGAGIAAQQKDFGGVLSHPIEDLENSKTIIIWGKNPVVTNVHFITFLKKAKEKGAKVVLIDPIKTATAAYADVHIQIKPGGDLAFAMAVAKYILKNTLYDVNFVENFTEGFEELKAWLSKVDNEILYNICGITEIEIGQFARALTENKETSINIGYGVQRYIFGGAIVRSIDTLGALIGNIGIKGGGINYANKVYGEYINWDAVAGDTNAVYRIINKPMLAKELPQLKEPPVKMLFISRGNPVVQNPNSKAVIKAIEGIEFKVVIDHFMTDSAKLADLVLPATYFLEEEDVIYSSMWTPYINYNKKCVERQYEAKTEFEIFTELADKMGFKDFPKYNSKQWIDILLSKLVEQGVNMEELYEKGYIKGKQSTEIPWEERLFLTDSQKFKLLEVETLKEYMESINAKGSSNTNYEYNLLTVHPKESLHSQHLMDRNDVCPRVYMNALDAKSKGIAEGEWVILYNEMDEIKTTVTLTEKCKEGVMYIDVGWWIKNGGSVNRITPDGISDIGEQAIYNECRCNVKKIEGV